MPPYKDPLERLRDKLLAIPAADVREPALPMAVFNQQGNDVVTHLETNPDVKSTLLKVGVPGAVLEALPLAMAASQAAESAWQAVFSRRRPEDLIALEQRGAELRSHVVAAMRWNLRDNRIVQGTLDAIVEGTGSADLVQDLDALALLIEQNAAAFEADETFDVKERAKACREHAKELRDSVSGARADMSRAEAKALRDRAYTHADDLLDEVREAARYVFRDDRENLARFQDRYALTRARRYRRLSAQAPAPAPTPEPADA